VAAALDAQRSSTRDAIIDIEAARATIARAAPAMPTRDVRSPDLADR
jgi:hypothetical protein